jgi:hypothetical protein
MYHTKITQMKDFVNLFIYKTGLCHAGTMLLKTYCAFAPAVDFLQFGEKPGINFSLLGKY